MEKSKPVKPATIEEAYKELSTAAFAVWIRLMTMEPLAFRSRGKMARHLGYGVSRTNEILRELRLKGYVNVPLQTHPGKPSQIVLLRRALLAGRSQFIQLAAVQSYTPEYQLPEVKKDDSPSIADFPRGRRLGGHSLEKSYTCHRGEEEAFNISDNENDYYTNLSSLVISGQKRPSEDHSLDFLSEDFLSSFRPDNSCSKKPTVSSLGSKYSKLPFCSQEKLDADPTEGSITRRSESSLEFLSAVLTLSEDGTSRVVHRKQKSPMSYSVLSIPREKMYKPTGIVLEYWNGFVESKKTEASLSGKGVEKAAKSSENSNEKQKKLEYQTKNTTPKTDGETKGGSKDEVRLYIKPSNSIDLQRLKKEIERSRASRARARKISTDKVRTPKPIDWHRFDGKGDLAFNWNMGDDEREQMIVVLSRSERDWEKKQLVSRMAADFKRIYTRYRIAAREEKGLSPGGYAFMPTEMKYARQAAIMCVSKGVTPRQLLEYWHANISTFADRKLKVPPIHFLSSPANVETVACQASVEEQTAAKAKKSERSYGNVDICKNSFSDTSKLHKDLRSTLLRAGFDVKEKTDRWLMTVQVNCIDEVAGWDQFMDRDMRRMVEASMHLYSDTKRRGD
jgi:hypothetical protein